MNRLFQLLIRILLLGLLTTAAGCSTKSAELKQGLKRWESSIPSSYVVLIEATGFSGNGRYLAVVEDGQVSGCSIEFGESTCTPERTTDGSDPVSELYDRAINHEGCKVEVAEIDDEYNYLVEYYLSCESEGYGEVVRCFVADTNNPSSCDAQIP